MMYENMICANSVGLRQYERQQAKYSWEWDNLVYEGQQEACRYWDEIHALVWMGALGTDSYDAHSKRLQRLTDAFDVMLDALSPETCPRSVEAFIELYSETYARLHG